MIPRATDQASHPMVGLHQVGAEMQNQEKAQNGRPAGRPTGSKQKLPPGHVDISGLADLLGLSAASIPNMEARGDLRIPPRSPLAGIGPHRRAIWRLIDVEANIEALATALRPTQSQPQPAALTWPTDQMPLTTRTIGGRGRPRGTGKFNK